MKYPRAYPYTQSKEATTLYVSWYKIVRFKGILYDEPRSNATEYDE